MSSSFCDFMLRNLSVVLLEIEYCKSNVLYISVSLLKEDRTETEEKKLSWQPEKDERNQR
jgi:hypothetical protein